MRSYPPQRGIAILGGWGGHQWVWSWHDHPPPARRPAWLAGRPAGGARILDFFLFLFQNCLKRAPRALGGPGGYIFLYFALFLAYFCPPWGALGGALGPPYFPYLGLLRCGEHLRCNLLW